jgi:hypothetical protein
LSEDAGDEQAADDTREREKSGTIMHKRLPLFVSGGACLGGVFK